MLLINDRVARRSQLSCRLRGSIGDLHIEDFIGVDIFHPAIASGSQTDALANGIGGNTGSDTSVSLNTSYELSAT